MRCSFCKSKAVLQLPQHHKNLCRDHFLAHFERQVERAVEKFRMFTRDDRILVAVSGGKDSLVLWDLLLRTGYAADGLYIHLGIGDYSEASRDKVLKFVESRKARLRYVNLGEAYAFTIPDAARTLRRPACSPCGLSKRYIFNEEARRGGYDVLATGHNLDDEAAVLLGNVLHWNTGYLARQYPVLEEREGGRLVRKVKPLIRLSERETAAYAVLRGIDYIVQECPMAKGARSIAYKERLNELESQSPGTKFQFLFGFFEHGRPRFQEAERMRLEPCTRCGQPTTGDLCAFCRMTARLAPVPAETS